MTKDKFVDQTYDKVAAYRAKHGKGPRVICIPLGVEKAIAKFQGFLLSQNVRTAYPKVMGFAVEWDAGKFEFKVKEKRKALAEPSDRDSWKPMK